MKLSHSLRRTDHFGFSSGFRLDHHPGPCHRDTVAFPVIPVDSFAIFGAAIDTIQVGKVAGVIPPGSCVQLSTSLIIVLVLCGEVILVMMSE